ncbi:thiamine pyrophosphate-binding protein [Sphingomonas sp. IC081]|uniref:thiamine pyrophosphate-binding protein n=1 Tax=Sphingomonas sp. IC081 TaxID=304378 RepID=UPI001158D38F|nr:thiamine pyrophosphate-binding protein [Sphingomonas sp. IC081]QDK35705.1 thiamine pyrophosphate-binding protein [Sphingomonas sp. IC081]
MTNVLAEVVDQPAESASHEATVGEVIVRLLEHWGVAHAFGVISIHNMPILDPLGVRGNIRFIPARGEAGGLNMADAYARVSGSLGVAFTSTGTAAGNAAGALVEALTAGSPVLHITGQVEAEHLDRNRAYIHEAPRQMDMLKAVSKAAFRVSTPDELVATMVEAATVALSAPTGPVSIEIPVDVQAAPLSVPRTLPAIEPRVPPTSPTEIASLAALLRQARRPVLLLGGGARGAETEATALADRGVAIITSTNGRGIVPEDHAMSLGAFNCTPQVQALYDEADLLIVAGSRLRGNETWTYKLRLPKQVAVIDCDASANGRTYQNELFVHGDVRTTLAGLLAAQDALAIDEGFSAHIGELRESMREGLRTGLGEYANLVDAAQSAIPKNAAWVRDVTISNSTWGNRYLRIGHSRAGVHAVGGGIGQGLPMAIGAALASPGGAFALTGDGGLSLCLGELATLAEEQPDVTLILMNDLGYGVIRNIQDVEYGERKLFSNILIPDFSAIAAAMGLRHEKISSVGDFPAALARARSLPGAAIVEVDMVAIGPYPQRFAGPPRLEK